MSMSFKASPDGTYGEILVNGQVVAKLPVSGNAVIPNLVGTVSQSGGVPTGAVVERGSNANGEYVRFADGTQICTGTKSTDSITANDTSGNTSVTFAATFAAAPTVVPMASPSDSNDHYGATSVQSVSTTGALIVMRNGGTTQTFQAYFISVGRWF